MAHTRTNAQPHQRTRNTSRAALAIDGGSPIRTTWLPYGRQSISEDDIAAVSAVLRSDWLTQGPTIAEFEKVVATFCGAKHAVAFSSGTAALHGAYFGCGITSGDEVIISALTFAATGNAALYLGATPRFADIDPNTGNIDPASIEPLINENTRAIVAVDFAGLPCALDELRTIAKNHNLFLIEDACHALGAEYKGKPIGSISDLSVFSFHPVKTITTGEGGMVTTDDPDLAHRLKVFRTHGIEKDPSLMDEDEPGPWYYEQQELGFNYRLTDIQAALGISQMRRLPEFLNRRRAIAKQYSEKLATLAGSRMLSGNTYCKSAHHLFPIVIEGQQAAQARHRLVRALHAENIGVQVHYIPVYKHPLYKTLFGDEPQILCPHTEKFYAGVLSLPIFPAMADEDVDDVVEALKKVLPVCLSGSSASNE